MVLLFNALAGSTRPYIIKRVEDKPLFVGIGICTALFLLPLCGWLADVFFGRYKVIHVSLLAMWASGLLNVVCVIITTITASQISAYIDYVLLLIMMSGMSGFQANIIQFGIDQLPDASSAELTSFILWLAWTSYIGGILVHIPINCSTALSEKYHFVTALIVVVNLSICMCLNFLFRHLLIKEPPMQNPFKLVLDVIKYAIKTKYPQQRSAFTYHEDELPSRFDFGKYKYGGPFTTEQVEDVKTFLRIALVIAIGGFAASTTWILQYPQQLVVDHLQGWNLTERTILSCIERTTVVGSDVIFVTGFVPLFELVLHPLFSKCIQSGRIDSFRKFTFGIVFCLLRIVALLTIEAISQANTNVNCLFTDKDYDVTNVDYRVSTVIGIFTGSSFLIMFTASVKLICSQSPYAMKGLHLGLGYGAVGFYTLIHMLIIVVFAHLESWIRIPFSCGFWYFLSLIILLITFSIALFAIIKWVYKKRQREDVLLNEQIFATEYYEKYTASSSSSDDSSTGLHSD